MKSEGMIFEKVVADDLDELAGLQPEGWTEIRSKYQFYVENEFCFPKKAVIDNKIVGLGCSVVFGSTAWLAHIIVDSNFRNRGIGLKIVEDLLGDIKTFSSVKSALLIATDMGEPVYKKAGFRVVSDYQFFYREKPWETVSVSENVKVYHERYYRQLIEMDKCISGENREPLIKQYLEGAMIYLDNNVLKGYYLPRLGDGMIFAENEIAGIELMKLKYSTIDKAVLPAENIAGVEFLKQNGFGEPKLEGKRMILGEAIEWNPEKIYGRIGGNYG